MPTKIVAEKAPETALNQPSAQDQQLARTAALQASATLYATSYLVRGGFDVYDTITCARIFERYLLDIETEDDLRGGIAKWGSDIDMDDDTDET